MSRTFNSFRNIIISLGIQFITLLLGFISRTIFIHALGAEYLGISGLYSNILTILSIAELGIGNAMIYNLYKPLAEDNREMIAALMLYYKNLYHGVAIIVATLGIISIPLLHYLVKTEQIIPKLTEYYILFLANSVFSYLWAYKAAVINADQKIYLTRIYSFVFYIIQFVLQTFALLGLHSFIWYIVMQLLATLGNNIYTAFKVNKMYPYICRGKSLEKYEKKKVLDDVKSLFLYKIGGIILNNTDNILISVLIGTIWVGYYSNYYYIVYSVQMFIGLVFSAMNASVGNLHVLADPGHKYEVFQGMNLLGFWITGFTSICLFVLLNDFIRLWVGEMYLLDIYTVLAILLNFYMCGNISTVVTFRDSNGMFKQTKYIFMATSILNIVLSILMGKLIGISGILFATAVSRILTNFWYEPMVLYRDYFHRNPIHYFKSQASNLLFCVTAGAATFFLCSIFTGTTVPGFMGKLLICLVVPNFVFYLAFRKTSDFQFLKTNYCSRILNFLHIRTSFGRAFTSNSSRTKLP